MAIRPQQRLIVATPHVPDAVAPPPGNPRFPLVDGLRAAAALGVLIGHVASVTGAATVTTAGDIGVDLQMGVTVCFVISGFLLYRPFVAADLGDRASPSPLRFYRRRILRIIPAYWLALTLFALLLPIDQVMSADWWKYYLLIQNFWGFDSAIVPGMGQAWTLSVEASFYLLLPLYALAMRAVGGRSPRRRLWTDLTVLLALGGASAYLRWQMVANAFPNGPRTPSVQFLFDLLPGQGLALTLPTYFAWFAIGMAFAVISSWFYATSGTTRIVESVSRHSNILWLLAVSAFLILLLETPLLSKGESPEHHLLTGLVAAFFVAPAAFPNPNGRGLPSQILSLRWVAWLGLISYGIYLWHNGLLDLMMQHDAIPTWKPYMSGTLILLAITIPVSAISYYLIEQPFLKLKEPRNSRKNKP